MLWEMRLCRQRSAATSFISPQFCKSYRGLFLYQTSLFSISIPISMSEVHSHFSSSLGVGAQVSPGVRSYSVQYGRTEATTTLMM